MKFFLNDVKLPVVKCKRPSFKDVAGRTWDSENVVFIHDGEEKNIEVYLDTTWGFYIYFFFAENWYKVRMMSTCTDKKEWDIDPFKNTHIIVKK